MGRNSSGSSEEAEQRIEECLDGVVEPETIDRVISIQQNGRGLQHDLSPPSDELVDYPDKMDAVDRVMHVLRTQKLREHSAGWIAQAAALPVDATLVVLEALATAGIVVSPEGTAKEGYQLNSFYEFYWETEGSVERLTDPVSDAFDP